MLTDVVADVVLLHVPEPVNRYWMLYAVAPETEFHESVAAPVVMFYDDKPEGMPHVTPAVASSFRSKLISASERERWWISTAITLVPETNAELLIA